MMEIKKHRGLIFTIFLIAGLAFYWYEYRPYSVKKLCYRESGTGFGLAKLSGVLDDKRYNDCLHRYGL